MLARAGRKQASKECQQCQHDRGAALAHATHTSRLLIATFPLGLCEGKEMSAISAARQMAVDVASAVTALSRFSVVFMAAHSQAHEAATGSGSAAEKGDFQ